jgi:hypothetical protein
LSVPSGASPPTDRKVARRDAEEPPPREREREPNGNGGRSYVLTLPAGEYRGEDDEQAGLMHLHRRDRGDQAGGHVCSVPAGEYELERDEAGVHLFKVDNEQGAPESEERHGERRGEEGEGEERDQAMGRNVSPRAPRLGRGRDDMTECQKLRAYQQRLNAHYDQYRNWIRERAQ